MILYFSSRGMKLSVAKRAGKSQNSTARATHAVSISDACLTKGFTAPSATCHMRCPIPRRVELTKATATNGSIVNLQLGASDAIIAMRAAKAATSPSSAASPHEPNLSGQVARCCKGLQPTAALRQDLKSVKRVPHRATHTAFANPSAIECNLLLARQERTPTATLAVHQQWPRDSSLMKTAIM